MTFDIKLRKVGDSVGVVFPKEALAHLKAGAGDSVLLVETADGFTVVAANSEQGKSMVIFEDLSRRYSNTLRALGK